MKKTMLTLTFVIFTLCACDVMGNGITDSSTKKTNEKVKSEPSNGNSEKTLEETEKGGNETVKKDESDDTVEKVISTFDENDLKLLKFDVKKVNLFIGQEYEFSLINTLDEKLQNNIVLSSNDEKIATVNQDGLVSAKSHGVAMITISIKGNEKVFDNCEIVVDDIVLLKNNTWTDSEIIENEDKWFCFVTKSDCEYEIAWDEQDDGTNTYTCDIDVSACDEDLSTYFFKYDDKGYTTPRVISVSNDGIVYIRVKPDVSDSSGTFAVKIKNIPVPEKIIIDNLNPEVLIGKDVLLNVGIFPPEAYQGLTYESLDESIATIDSSGKVLGVSIGETAIKITSEKNENIYSEVKLKVLSNKLIFDKWAESSFEEKGLLWFYFEAEEGKDYNISWDEGEEGSGTYTAGITASAYLENKKDCYFKYDTSGFDKPHKITALENGKVYVKISCSSLVGSFAVKVSEIIE